MSFFAKEKNMLKCSLNSEHLLFIPWEENSLRVLSRKISKPELTDWALLPQGETASEITIEERKARITVGKISAEIKAGFYGSGLHISFYNQKGELLLAEKEFGSALQLDARFFNPRIGGDYKLKLSFESYENEKLYGMGQYQQPFLDIKGCNYELAQRNSQASVPFLLSNRGYGFLWHNPAIGTANFGKNLTEWTAESTKQMDYWITAGDTPAEIEERFSAVVGRAPMMPEYGMGYWQCKLRYWNQEQLLSVAREYKRRNIPIDVIICDYFHWPHMGDFRFDEEYFPDPDEMVKELKEMGIELMVSVWPQISLFSENYREMKEKGLIVQSDKGVNIAMQYVEDSVFYDATNPEARKYVWEKCKQNYYDKGIKAFWLDEAEPEFAGFDYENYRFYSGTDLQTGNIFPQNYSRGFYEGMTAEGQENVINLVRCAWTGSQRYGALVWSGDIHSNWPTLKDQICAGQSMAIAGIPWWTTDIGGFVMGDPSDPEFQELVVRWFQWGAFCPVMRMHGFRTPIEEIKRGNGGTDGARYDVALGANGPMYARMDGSINCTSGGDNEIWSYGEDNYEIMKKYIELRENMRPYIRELMRQAHKNGSPVMRPMFYEFPNEKICWNLNLQYMFGPDLLVAPITEPKAGSREVYLPEGASWTDMRSGQEYAGGQTMKAQAPIDYMPVFIKNRTHPELVGTV